MKDKREKKRSRRKASSEEMANKEFLRRLRAIERHLRSAAADGTPVDPTALIAALATGAT